MRVSSFSVFALAVVLSSCPPSVGGGALSVTVTLAPGSTSRCVLVKASSPDGMTASTAPIVVGRTRAPLGVAVLPFTSSATITLQATGFSDVACSSATMPTEESPAVSATFPTAGTTPVTLAITVGAAIDGDNDSSPSFADCDDADPERFPGNAERCADGIDNDCNSLVDCADTACAAKACGSGTDAVCVSGACAEQRCDDGDDDDLDGFKDCADVDCGGKTCVGQGICVAGGCADAAHEIALCDDGLDNDNDGTTDCLDSDCSGSHCNDGLACTTGELCVQMSCTAGSAVTCTTAPGACFSSTGVCREDLDGGCSYPVNVANACSDGVACTVADACQANGTCSGTPTVCNAPPSGQCFISAGVCRENRGGACEYGVRSSGFCDDGNNCTIEDSCQVDGGCGGSPLNCTPAECETFAGQCSPSGSCIFGVALGASCAGGAGVCDEFAQCIVADAGVDAGTDDDAGTPDAGPSDSGVDTPVDAGTFDAGVLDAGPVDAGPPDAGNLVPSNFTRAQLAATSGSVNFTLNCGVVLNTGLPALATPAIYAQNGCVAPALPPYVLIPQAGGPELIVFSVDSLDIGAFGVMAIIGERAPVFAVKGNATIAGTIDVSASDSNVFGKRIGPGADGSYCNAGRGNDGTSGATHGGGGGGGFWSGGNRGGNGGNGGLGGDGGVANGVTALTPLRGGCSGAYGGGVSGLRGDYGRAGGALQLSVFGTLTLTGALNAAGGGGGRGVAFIGAGGGGGGGSGGALLVEAQTLVLGTTARLTANGGGGGQGSTTVLSGTDGASGRSDDQPAAGGASAPTCRGAGGNGAAQTAPAGAGSNGASCSGAAVGSGGGGGGGVGRIRLNASKSCTVSGSALLSPAASRSGC